MRLSRRHFLGGTITSGVVAGAAPMARAASVENEAQDGSATPPAARRTLAKLFETFVPSDETGPGAHESGALEEYLQMLEAATPGRRNWIVLGCRWLDAQAATLGAPSFALLDEDGRDEALSRAANAPRKTGERRFFEDMRRTVFRLHYSRPATWAALGYEGPPQPVGFPDYASAPRDGG